MPSLLTFGFEPLAYLIQDAVFPVAVARHWREAALDQQEVPLDIDWMALVKADQAGTQRWWVARRDGKLVGYIQASFVRPARYRTTDYIAFDTLYASHDEPNRARTLIAMLDAFVAAAPRPAKLTMQFRPDLGGERIGRIVQRRYGMKTALVGYSVVLPPRMDVV